MEVYSGYQRNVERNTDDTPVLNSAANELIHAAYTNVALKFNERDHGYGTAYVTTTRVIWIANDRNDVSYGFPYQSMVLHALSKDTKLAPTPCVFIQLQGDTAEVEDDEQDIPVVVLVPNAVDNVEEMFEAISKMNSLVEPPPSESEDDSDYDGCFDQDGIAVYEDEMPEG